MTINFFVSKPEQYPKTHKTINHSDMRNTVISCVLALCATAFGGAAKSPLRINEIMTSNMHTLMADHQYPDSWVEIYNDSSEPVSPAGYLIGKKAKISKAYKLPESLPEIPAKGFGLVFCDKEDTDNHTDFRLDADGGSLYLFAPDSTLIDYIEYPAQPATDISFGRLSDSGEWSFLITPTPQGINSGKSATILMPEPVFSHESAMFPPDDKRAFDLEITIPDDAPAGTVILLTTDGREPQPIDRIESDRFTKHVSDNTIIRAKLHHPDYLSRPSSARSFVYPPDNVENVDVVSIITDPAGLNDPTDGIFNNVTKNWRRPGVIHYFQASEGHNQIFDQVMEFRVQGGITRTQPQQALAIYAHKRYTPNGCFNATIWPAKPNVTAAKSFVLRAGGNTWAYERINDQLVAELARHYLPSVDYMAYTPAIYFINGEYMGITDVRERSNEDFVWANYGGLEDIDMLENNKELKSGSRDSYEEFIDLSNSAYASWSSLSKHADMDGLLDQFVLRAFGHDTDFPHNNIVCWRPSDGSAPWKWIMKDIDRFGIIMYRSDVEKDFGDHIKWLCTFNQHQRYMGPFTFFYNNAEASEKYLERMAVFAGDFLQPESGTELIDSLCQFIAPHIVSTMQHYDPKGWNSRVSYWEWATYDMKNNWWPARQKAIYQVLANRFKLGQPTPLTIEREDPESAMSFNGIDLRRQKFNGMYFAQRPFVLESEDYGEWTLTATQSDGQQRQTTTDGYEFSYTLPENLSSAAITFHPTQAPEDFDRNESGIKAIEINNLLIISCIGGGISEISIFNLQGRQLLTRKFSSEKVSLEASELPSGPTIIRIVNSEGKTSVFKRI